MGSYHPRKYTAVQFPIFRKFRTLRLGFFSNDTEKVENISASFLLMRQELENEFICWLNNFIRISAPGCLKFLTSKLMFLKKV